MARKNIFRFGGIVVAYTQRTGYYIGMDIENTILSELKSSKATLQQIADGAGLNVSVVCRARQGQPLTARNASKLLRHFGYSITKDSKK